MIELQQLNLIGVFNILELKLVSAFLCRELQFIGAVFVCEVVYLCCNVFSLCRHLFILCSKHKFLSAVFVGNSKLMSNVFICEGVFFCGGFWIFCSELCLWGLSLLVSSSWWALFLFVRAYSFAVISLSFAASLSLCWAHSRPVFGLSLPSRLASLTLCAASFFLSASLCDLSFAEMARFWTPWIEFESAAVVCWPA